MANVLLVPGLPLDRSAAMDKYAHRLHDWLESGSPGFDVRLAAHIGELTRDQVGEGERRRSSGSYVRWWNQPIDPSRLILPGPLSGPQSLAARQFFYPLRVRREARRADLVHILDHAYAGIRSSVRKKPVVVTVHDLMPVIVLRSPTGGWRESLRNRLLRRSLKALRTADAFIVGTEWLRGELATWLGDDKKIHVIPFGVDRAFFREAPGGRLRGRNAWRIPEDAFVVLHVGSTVERKNVPLVIQTVARLRMEVGEDVHLLQVGGRLTPDQEQLVQKLGLERSVRSVPAADETTLRRAYRAADVLLFPSLYEGFGFPVLEAFASGLPVIASGAGGLREVGGDAAVIVESRDPAAYVQALMELSDDAERREALIDKGLARAGSFTWRRTAEQTADVYRTFI
jgi:glycosyltransferase involved in cell wall biosynthesis